MNYILQKVEVNGNADRFGGADTKTDIAVSADIEKLQKYCKETYNQEAFIGEPKKFQWNYYTIIVGNLIIL